MVENRVDPEQRPTLWQQVTHSYWAVLAMLFLVTGALGLPLLWSSPMFSYAAKWFWSIAVTLYTLALIAFAVAVVWWAYSVILSLS